MLDYLCPIRYSIDYQDTYRAEWAWLLLFAPERVPGMIQSMLQDYIEVRIQAAGPKTSSM